MRISRNPMRFGYRCVRILVLLAGVGLSASLVHADVVTDWIKVMNDTVLAGNSNPLAVGLTLSGRIFRDCDERPFSVPC
jgi:hypothetical protein